MHKIKKNLSNIIFFIVFIFILFKKSPEIMRMYEVEGTNLKSVEIQDINLNPLTLPLPKRKQIIIFWATWCSPCGIELARINKLIKDDFISKESVLAISIGEDLKTVSDYVIGKKYLFNIALDTQEKAAKLLNVNATPTLVFIDEDGSIRWMTSGISPTLELRLLSFLKKE